MSHTFWSSLTNLSSSGIEGGVHIPEVDADHAEGLLSGTPVLTPYGSLDVSEIRPGAMVETFEDGLREVRAVVQRRIWGSRVDRSVDQWPFYIPDGVLGNDRPLALLPHQAVLFECDQLETMAGDPFVLVPVRALEGFRGITPMQPKAEALVHHLLFDRPEVVGIAGGTYVLNDYRLSSCVARGEVVEIAGCRALSVDGGRAFMGLLENGYCRGCTGHACRGRGSFD
ncbi:Hint domain-containing protein [Nioella sp.]|uniref:Hint domain-containing protein n=1 Tax=Nioella sp. TaxID=1912091 RepID=UPI003517ED29